MKLSDFEEKFLSERNYYPDGIEEGVKFLPYNDKEVIWKTLITNGVMKDNI